MRSMRRLVVEAFHLQTRSADIFILYNNSFPFKYSLDAHIWDVNIPNSEAAFLIFLFIIKTPLTPHLINPHFTPLCGQIPRQA